MKKIQPQRLEACYCNTDDTRTRPSSEIHAKYYTETAQVSNINKYVRIDAAEPRKSSGRSFFTLCRKYILNLLFIKAVL